MATFWVVALASPAGFGSHTCRFGLCSVSASMTVIGQERKFDEQQACQGVRL
jgi:hypothetical protein